MSSSTVSGSRRPSWDDPARGGRRRPGGRGDELVEDRAGDGGRGQHLQEHGHAGRAV